MSGGAVFVFVLVAFCNTSLAALYVYLRRKGRLWGRDRLTPREAAHRRLDALAAANDPVRLVGDAYVAGEFDYDELDWRMALAFMPPVPRDRVTASSPLAKIPGEHCGFRELTSGSGYVGTFCDCGHDMNQHYNGGCTDCDAFRSGIIVGGQGCIVAVQERPARRQSHG